MKPVVNINLSLLLLAISFLTYISLSSCKKIPDPTKDKTEKDTISYDLLKTSLFIQFIDANTNELIIPEENDNLKVEIVGPSKDVVADILGIQKDQYIARKGFLSFGLIPDVSIVPSQSSPVSFTIVASLNGYFTSTKEIVLTEEGDYIQKIFMINTVDPPPGVIIKKVYDVGTLVNGVLQESVSVATINSEAMVVIPAGVRLLDNDSVELVGGLNLSIIYHNNNDDKALATLKGGITGTVTDNNNTKNGVFFPAGLLTIEIFGSDWRKAATIENEDLILSVLVNSDTYNPVTNTTAASDDSVQLFSYIDDSGLWAIHQWVVLSDTIFDGLYAVAKTKSLDTYSLSWFEENSCTQGSSFELSGDCRQCGSIMLNGIVRKQTDNSFVSNVTLGAVWDNSIHIPFSTGTTPVYIEWDQGDECNCCNVNPSINPLNINDMCIPSNISLSLIDESPTSVSIQADFYGTCLSDTNVVILPSYGLWVRQADATCWRWSSMKNGKAQICNLIYGDTYVFGTYYNGIWKEWQVIINDETDYKFELEFSQSVCLGVFGIL